MTIFYIKNRHVRDFVRDTYFICMNGIQFITLSKRKNIFNFFRIINCKLNFNYIFLLFCILRVLCGMFNLKYKISCEQILLCFFQLKIITLK